MSRLLSLITVYCLLITVLPGCGVTYPKETLKESIVRVCKSEYKIDVKVETVGKTIAIYLPIDDLMDFTFSISKEAGEKINDVILSVARVALSTDADYNFYCVIAHDKRIPEIQIVIIKSVSDVKRLLLNDISRGEYSKRILIDLRLNPQSQKERSVKEVFQKMGLDDKWQETVMNDFFRSEPAALGDIGYWSNRFYIKDISQAEFLAEQMASRVKIEFRDDKDLNENLVLKAARGSYVAGPDKRYFRLEVLAEPKWLRGPGFTEGSDRLFRRLIAIASHVVHAYRFEDFDHVELVDQAASKKLSITKDDLEKLRTKKMKFEELVIQ